MKNKPLTFTVSFDVPRVYSDKEATPINEIQDVFAQNTIFVAGIINAIHRLTYEMQSVDESDETTVRSCETLTVLGKVFLIQMEEQFDRLLEIAQTETHNSQKIGRVKNEK